MNQLRLRKLPERFPSFRWISCIHNPCAFLSFVIADSTFREAEQERPRRNFNFQSQQGVDFFRNTQFLGKFSEDMLLNLRAEVEDPVGDIFIKQLLNWSLDYLLTNAGFKYHTADFFKNQSEKWFCAMILISVSYLNCLFPFWVISLSLKHQSIYLL